MPPKPMMKFRLAAARATTNTRRTKPMEKSRPRAAATRGNSASAPSKTRGTIAPRQRGAAAGCSTVDEEVREAYISALGRKQPRRAKRQHCGHQRVHGHLGT